MPVVWEPWDNRKQQVCTCPAGARSETMEALAAVPAIEWVTALTSVAGPIGLAYALRNLIRRRDLARRQADLPRSEASD